LTFTTYKTLSSAGKYDDSDFEYHDIPVDNHDGNQYGENIE